MEATGRSFTTTTINDQGAFTFPELELSSKYVKISIDGYYFNEVSGQLSGSRIVLSAYSDITSSSININTLTHLEMERVKSLIINSNMSFEDAKTQARTEVLKAFGITKTIARPENISITSNNTDAGVLLAVSAIMLKNNTDASLTEMLAKLGQDIADNGTLDNTSLITHITGASE